MNKKYAISSAVLGCVAMVASAVPADPAPKPVVQPDGTVVCVRILGDEYGHTYADADGNPLVRDASGMFVRAAESRHFAGMRSPARRDGRQKMVMKDFPTIGEQKSLVILMEFSDVRFSSIENPKDFYTRMLNEEGFTWSNGAKGSARDFYLVSSDGKFEPTFVVAGPVLLTHEATYYGSDANGQDYRMGEAIKEACDAVSAEIDFSEFDCDDDGIVDNIFFFYAGNGQADTPTGTDLIWPHSAQVDVAWKMQLEYDGKKVSNYACSNEVRYSSSGDIVPSGIGTFVHEFGHVLGLADHYDTSYGMFNFGLGPWDTMASGSYNNNMHTPPLFSAYERASLGWLELTDLDLSYADIHELSPIGDPDKTEAYRVKVLDSEGEFFIFENRQQTGWDEYLPGHGLLSWHIDEDQEIWNTNMVNVDPEHQRIDIIEVDGTGSEASRAGDIMPGAANVTSYSFLDWNGRKAVAFDDVSEEDGKIYFLLENVDFRLPAPESIEVSDLADDAFSFTWDAVDRASYYLVTVTRDGTPLNGLDGVRYSMPETVKLSGLECETDYVVKVTAGRGSYLSSPATLSVTTPGLAFFKRLTPSPVLEKSGNGVVTARWEALDGADSYRLILNRVERATQAAEIECGFDNKKIPDSWTSTSGSFYSAGSYVGLNAPSLRFIKDGDYLIVRYPESLIDNIRFWYKSSGDNGALVVETPGEDGAEWAEVGRYVLSRGEGTADIALPGVEMVRVRFERTGGYVVVDDFVTAVRSLVRTPVEAYRDAVAESGSYTFGDLTKGTYGLTVIARQGDVEARPSSEATITLGDTGITAVDDCGRAPVAFVSVEGMLSKTPFDGVNIVIYSDGSRSKLVINRK